MNQPFLETIRRTGPRRYVFWMLAAFFVIEMVVMDALDDLLPCENGGLALAATNAAVLSLITAPLIWLTVIRPLRSIAFATGDEFRIILESAADAIIVIDQEGIVETFNKAAEKMFGYDSGEMVGRNVALLMPDPYRTNHDQYMKNYMDTGIRKIIGIRREVVARRKNGAEFSAEIHVSETQLDRRGVFVGIVTDISERFEAQRQLQLVAEQLENKNAELNILAAELVQLNTEFSLLARCDALTGLLNRRAWFESAHIEHERFVRYQSRYAVVMIDVDHFKRYNDSLGHQAGDECLKKFAKCVSSALRVTDTLGRYGGEEMIVLLPETDREGALELAERIRQAVWGMNLSHPDSPTADRVTISLGVSAIHPGAALGDVIRAADDALYAAKRDNRNRACFQEIDPATAIP